MKKMILLAAIASITLASCVKNEMEVVDNDDQEITFQTEQCVAVYRGG